MNQPVISINDVDEGDRVRSTVDGMLGTVMGCDYSAIKVRWDDDTYSQFSRKDGFVGFSMAEAA